MSSSTSGNSRLKSTAEDIPQDDIRKKRRPPPLPPRRSKLNGTANGTQSDNVTKTGRPGPLPPILSIINDMEARIKHHFSLCKTQRHLRTATHKQQPFRLLDLPLEIREIIYEFAWGLSSDDYFSVRICYPSVSIRRVEDSKHPHRTQGNALLRVNKQVSNEAARTIYSQTTLHIESAPFRKPESLQHIKSVRTAWFLSTTRHVSIRSSFAFDLARNVSWVKGLQNFRAMISLEVLLEVGKVLGEYLLKNNVTELLPFIALKCDIITFRGPAHVLETDRKDVEAVWEKALLEEGSVGPKFIFAWSYVRSPRRIAIES